MVLEAFLQQRPSIVLDVGGPALSVDSDCGIKISLDDGKDVVEELARAMTCYSDNPDLILTHGKAGYEKLRREYDWERKSIEMNKIYVEAVGAKM